MSTTRREGDREDCFGVSSKDSKAGEGGDVPESDSLVEGGAVDDQGNASEGQLRRERLQVEWEGETYVARIGIDEELPTEVGAKAKV